MVVIVEKSRLLSQKKRVGKREERGESMVDRIYGVANKP